MKVRGSIELFWAIVLPVAVVWLVYGVSVRATTGEVDYAPGYADSPGYMVFDYTGDRVVNGKMSDSDNAEKLRTFLDKMDGRTGRGSYGSVEDTRKVYGIAFTGDSGKLSSRYAVHKEKGVWHVYRIGKRLGKMELKTDVRDREKLDMMVMDVLNGND